MRNVDFHFTDRIAVHIAFLNGALKTNYGSMPVFDDKESFDLEVTSANIAVTMESLSNDLNDYVFVKPDAPLKKLSVMAQGERLGLKGVLANKGNVPFEMTGTVSATPDGQIRIHTVDVKALHLSVKGLLDLLGLDTAKLIDTKKIAGVTADKDDLILDPQQILPAPHVRGQVRSTVVQGGALTLVFGKEQSGAKVETMASHCGARNFQAFRGGTVRFGKLTMDESDLELVDADPLDPFDFSIDHYHDQLVAGYSKTTKRDGLCVYMPDFNKLKNNPSPR